MFEGLSNEEFSVLYKENNIYEYGYKSFKQANVD
jgi:hypothetical protein